MTGKSRLKMAVTQSLPNPGQAKIFSTTKAPAISLGMDIPRPEAVPLKELSNIRLMMKRSGRQRARANFTQFSFEVLIISERISLR